MRSIQSRLLLAASVVLALFLGLGAIALDRAFRDSLESALETQLMGQVYALLGAAETDNQGRMRLPKTLPDPRLVSPDSGLYVQVKGEQGNYQWHSPSSIARQLPPQTPVPSGQQQFDYLSDDESFYQLNYSLLWEDDTGREIAYLFTVSESAESVQKRIAVFRRTILLWLGGAAFILLILQGVVLRWGMKPLRTVEDDLQMIETGMQEQLQGDYPKELRRLTQGINSLIKHNSASRDRYRHSLGDLAHSLKTPLAVLQGTAEGQDAQQLREAIAEQIPRMNEIIQYQLKAAAVAGRVVFAQATPVRPIIDRLVETLDKVYHDKLITCRCDVDAEQLFTGEPGDLLECLGNLLENAYKYGRSQVHIYLDETRSMNSIIQGRCLCIEDDGPGIPQAIRVRVLRRGERADQRTPGQGIGLSVASGIVHLYGGKLEIGDSPLGGALISIQM
ncbi:ATP-binding protein [Sedimenticola selenatireducens]|uniref:histidine kinase n=1 Tax=Sedimenticola selenatireducens TaxID=191960 RepID=A0A558DSA6_9GAMM|nr:ATP-binding protein [Sedimenticola selenatireducens]TVO75944.1 histidine kinase [Sedimenticola selenatireducens]TVT63803.1 MAG: histidine kinase [Sedimenticola selenatireducens]